MRAVSIIANPEAAGGRPLRALPAVCARLRDLGVDYEVTLTRDLNHARALAQEAATTGRVAAGFGGDGLIGAVAEALAGGEGILGVLPGGRGNDFARTLEIPALPAAACGVLAGGRLRRIDLGRVGTRTFVGIASVGFDSDANRIANDARLVRGGLVYAYGAIRALAGWSPATFRVQVDGVPHSFSGYSVAAANSPAYGGGMRLAPDASLQDGLLDIVTIHHVSRPRFLALLPTVFSGRHLRQPFVYLTRARQVHVSADRPMTLFADGDPIAELPATIEVLPGAVQVLVPHAP